MIERLLVKNSVAFSEVCIEPSPQFNIFSGVSGSGKSLLMESILALFGLKDSNASLIEATFNAENITLPENIELDSELILSIVKKDKIKYFLNSQSFSKKRAKELFSECVKYITAHSIKELQEQNLLFVLDSITDFLSQNLSQKEKYFQLLDNFKLDYKNLMDKKRALEHLENEEKNIIELREFAHFEISQIEGINPKIGEYEELLELKKSLSKKEKILEKIALLKPQLEGFDSILAFLETIDKNKEIYSEILHEISGVISDEAERLEAISQDSIEEILNRLEKLSNLVHKYGSIEATLAHLEKKKRDLEHYNNISFNKNNLQKELDFLTDSTMQKAQKIRKARQGALNEFSAKLESYCKKLKLNKPKIVLKDAPLGANGIDSIEIYLGDSSIETLSSGEFNRLKLAIMCVEVAFSKDSARKNNTNGILILDEIDANLSGSESEGVAEVLALLSKKYQIFAISHQSHMVAYANNHYLVSKSPSGSTISLLDKNGRINEIARMISGANITQEALNFAKEKLKSLQ